MNIQNKNKIARTNFIKPLAILLVTIGMLFSGFPLTTNIASASCDPNSPPGRDVPQSPVINSLNAPTGSYTNPGNIPIKISGQGGYICEGEVPIDGGGFGWEQVSTVVTYAITNNAGVEMYHGFWNTPLCNTPLCVPRDINVDQVVDASTWPGGFYTIKVTATTESAVAYVTLSDYKQGFFAITRNANPTTPTRKTFTTDLAVIDTPQVSFLSGGSNSIVINPGTRPTFNWTTSSVADGDSCIASNDNHDSTWDGPRNGPGGGTETIGQFYTPNVVHYYLVCTGFNGFKSTVQTIQITVNTATYTCTVSPLTDEMYIGGTRAFVIHTTNINAYWKPVTFTQNVSSPGVLSVQREGVGQEGLSDASPTTPPGLNFTYDNNGQVPDAFTTAIVTADSHAVPGLYTISFTGSDGVVCPDVTLNIKAFSPPGSPTLSAKADAPCGQIVVTWVPGNPTPPTTTFQVWKKYQSNGVWVQVGNEVKFGELYEVTDDSPQPTNNYYKVVATNGLSTDSNVLGPISPASCAPSLNGSFKKIVGSGSTTPTFNRCSDPNGYVLPDGLVYKSGDKVYFEVCVKNSGGITLDNVTVTENLGLSPNLNKITYVNSAASCVTEATGGTRGLPPVLTIGGMAPGQVCSILLSGEISNPGGSLTAIRRFWNTADLSSTQITARVSSPKTQFSIGSGVPVRHETAP